METGKWTSGVSDDEEYLQTKDETQMSEEGEVPKPPQEQADSWIEHAKKFHSFGPDRGRVKPSEWWILL